MSFGLLREHPEIQSPALSNPVPTPQQEPSYTHGPGTPYQGVGDCDFWVFTHSGTALRVPQVNERGSPFPGREPREPQRNSWETLPFGLTLPPSPGILQKLRVREKGGTEDRRHSGSQASCRPASTHARPRRSWRRRCSRELGGHEPAAGSQVAEDTRPDRSPGTHLRVDAATTYPVFLAPGGDRKPLFISSYRIHGGSSRGKGLNVPTTLHPKGLPTQKASPLVVGVGPQVKNS